MSRKKPTTFQRGPSSAAIRAMLGKGLVTSPLPSTFGMYDPRRVLRRRCPAACTCAGPGGGAPQTLAATAVQLAAETARLLKYAQCMRAHGGTELL